MSKSWNPAMNVMTDRKKIDGVSSGMVIERNCRQVLAPSIAVAS